MKYMVICLVALAVCLVAGALIVRALGRRRANPFGRIATVLLSVACGLVLLVVAALVYLQVHYPAGDQAAAAMQGDDQVAVERTADGWLFDGPGTTCALAFYSGAKVDEQAYAPLMLQLANQGIDCFLLDVPARMALFEMDAAQGPIASNDYDTWIVAGHSMGGVAAASYAAEHPDQVDGLVLLASYPSDPVPDQMGFCSIYGSKDGCLDREAYDEGRAFWPADATEQVVEGGNHAGVADYGPQRGDGQASITAEEQQRQTAAAILDMSRELQE